MIDIEAIMRELALERNLFHSEADFQHSLAWKIRQLHPEASIRLEYPLVIDKSKIHLDLFVILENQKYAIELKYATTRLEYYNNTEYYDLRDQSADDLTRHAFCKDIKRLEHMLEFKHCTTGYAIILSNYPSFWTNPKIIRPTNDMDFRINEGRTLYGNLQWGTNTKSKSIPNSILLKGNYNMNWKDYSNIDSVKNGYFKYAVVRV